MDKKTSLSKIEDYVMQLFQNEGTGHDYYHMKRVALMARGFAREENADTFVAEAAGWLHDIGDKKLFNDPFSAKEGMKVFLQQIGLDDEQISTIERAVADVSFSKGHKKPSTLEGQIVQDADRLDALGAVGIARTFAYGGANGQLIHSENTANTSIQHFYDKLLLLKDLMITAAAKKEAGIRHQFMKTYLAQFFKEWDEQ
ncbi:HD domain-containing protein [Sediminibacillus albus]|uniref:HD domain-containing protein n=1 Tax=Sediminibacillus albus TaxID=407036 RepID=A0A1G8VR43_9BACI|nr:HD domain-containing protein [Sediminibacillus albus]SDJ68363.1 uncharacterized protein SAMN05216243_0286 [Sediminibacillus albus]